jgi:hypothetical protein
MLCEKNKRVEKLNLALLTALNALRNIQVSDTDITDVQIDSVIDDLETDIRYI